MKKTLIAVLATVSLVGCGSTQNEKADIQEQFNQNDNVPNWVFMPTEPNGLASATCVPWSGNMQTDRSQAVAAARTDLAQQIEVRAQVMDQAVQNKTTEDGLVETNSSFQSVAKQVSNQRLNGAIPKHVSFATIDEKKQLCAMVVMNADKTKQLFDAMMIAVDANANPMGKKAMFEQFKIEKTKEELQALLGSSPKPQS